MTKNTFKVFAKTTLTYLDEASRTHWNWYNKKEQNEIY